MTGRTLGFFSALTLCLLLVFGTAPSLRAQVEEAGPGAGWNVTATGAPTRAVEFETTEGTWMSVDVSPDGRTIVFDLLGDLYLLPVEGGEARLLRGGAAYETQPRFSPDGTRLAFTSDRDGIENIWIVGVDGGDAQQITHERERQVKDPIWTPDGDYIIARKHYRNTRSLGAGEMWLWHVGGGDGLQLTERRNWEQNAGEPNLSPDGRHLYYSEDITPGGGFQYNRDPHAGIYAIQRLDRRTGETETFVRRTGGAARPQISPDGRTLAFVRRSGASSVLYLHDVESGREWPLWDRLDHDQQEAWALFGIYPGFSWTPDGERIVIWAEGGLWSVDAATGGAEPIPFRATVSKSIAETLRFKREVAPDSFDVRMLRWVEVSPDERHVAYTALGKIWVRPLPEGTARRLTDDDGARELYPSFSPDGRTIVYASWSDEELGAIRTIRLDGTGAAKVTSEPGHYVEPSFSRDGERIVYRRVSGDNLRGNLYSRETGIYHIAAAGGPAELVTREGSRPRYNREGDRVFLASQEDGDAALVSVDLYGRDRFVHLVAPNATELVPAPDERHVAVVQRFHAYVAPLPLTGQPVRLSEQGSAYPVTRLTRDAGTDLHWTPDSGRLYWSLGPYLHHHDLREVFAYLREPDDDGVDHQHEDGARDGADPSDREGAHIGFRVETDRPDGSIALVGATVITMAGDEVIPDATIIVDGDRIAAVGPSQDVAVPAGAYEVDVNGRTIIPGLIDVHAHGSAGSNGITPNTHWGYYANLAFGVTTLHNPSAPTDMIFSSSEMAAAGALVAPRLYSTGTILYGAESPAKTIVNDYDDAVSHLRRLKTVGAFSVKSYNQPRRDHRQMIVEAARELEMLVVPEGGSTFFWNMTQVLDGHTGIEHNIPVAPLYNDVLTLMASSGIGYTPTLVVNFGGLSGEYYWYQESNVWEHERLLRFVPAETVIARSRRRELAADDDYHYRDVARAAKDLADRGVSVHIGAHGQLQGLAAHWETWMLVQGGMTPHQALRAATLSGAQYLGLDDDLGSLEPGKLADLVVLERNPLDDVRNSESVALVMVNGRLYDATTMNEIGNHPRERGRFPWER